MPLSGFRYAQDDFDGDMKTVTHETMDVTLAGGFTGWETKLNAYQAALALWSCGREHRVEHIIVHEDNGAGKATTPVAQGNLRLILEGQDVLTGSIYRYPLPMPDLAKAADGTDPAWIAVGQGSQSLTVANPAHASWATLVAAFEAIVMSPNENGVTLVRAYIEE